MQKVITMKEFSDELKQRLEDGKTVDCCKTELLRMADIVSEKLADETIEVNWSE
jgi:hypothetical protein